LTKINRQLREEIAERKTAQHAQRASEERLLFVAECAQVGYWHWDLPTGALEWSGQCRSLFGLPRGDSISYASFLASLHPDDKERTERSITQCLNNERLSDFDIEYRILKPDGSGGDVFQAVQQRQRIPGVVMSGYGLEEDLQRSSAAGFLEHLTKPITIDRLMDAIRKSTQDRPRE